MNSEDMMEPVESVEAMRARAEWVRAVNSAASGCAGVIGKEGKNSHQGYAFVGHEHVIRHVKAAMDAAELVVGAPLRTSAPVAHTNGKFAIWAWVLDIPVYHSGGHREVFQVVATTQANDKSAFVASTAADRTLRLRLMGLAGGAAEDPEHDSQGPGVGF